MCVCVCVCVVEVRTHVVDAFISSTKVFVSGADPGFQNGGGTPTQPVENSEINHIHDHLINGRSNVLFVR